MAKRASLYTVVSLCVIELMLIGCRGVPGRSEARVTAAADPLPGKAVVVFFRPPSGVTFVDYARAPIFRTQSAEFVLNTSENSAGPEIVGILSSNTKIAYQVDPGKHLFMVQGEGAEFIAADVLPGKVYYVLISASPSKRGPPRYSVKAVDTRQQTPKDFKELLEKAIWVVKTPESLSYTTANINAIKTKQAEGYRLWKQTAETGRAYLLPEYGAMP